MGESEKVFYIIACSLMAIGGLLTLIGLFKLPPVEDGNQMRKAPFPKKISRKWKILGWLGVILFIVGGILWIGALVYFTDK